FRQPAERQVRHSAPARLWTTRPRGSLVDMTLPIAVGQDLGEWLRSSRAAGAGKISMRDAIAFALSNFTLTFFVLGLLASAIALWHTRQPRSFAIVVEALFAYFLLFSIGFANLYNFVMHVFFGKQAAAFIGWDDSPFQTEVGFASLGMAVVGLLAFKGSFDL